jgi:hypothetical protein
MPLPMSDHLRADKTTHKTMRGGLPGPNGCSRQIGLGDGRTCDGCGETIEPTEILFTVTLLDALSWRFHAVCCEAWLKFKEKRRPEQFT